MAIPVAREDVQRVLLPWLGSLFLSSNTLVDDLAEHLRGYAPYRQTLLDLRDELESGLLTALNRLTRHSMLVLTDSFHSKHLTMSDIVDMTDDLMGVVFDKLTPFSANFVKINDYSLHVASLSALRVLYERYASFFTQEQFDFLIHMIKTLYPPQRYQSWLGG